MEHINDWVQYNQKNILSAKEYVNDNLYRLISTFHMEDEDFTTEEKEQILIDYFTKFPDQISSISVQTVGRPNQMSVPKLNNIGGAFKS